MPDEKCHGRGTYRKSCETNRRIFRRFWVKEPRQSEQKNHTNSGISIILACVPYRILDRYENVGSRWKFPLVREDHNRGRGGNFWSLYFAVARGSLVRECPLLSPHSFAAACQAFVLDLFFFAFY